MPPQKCLDVRVAIRLKSISGRPNPTDSNRLTMLRKSFISVLALLFIVSITVSASAQSDLPHVLVIATGGTIAGEQGEPGTLGGYEIRKPINEVIGSVPEVRKYAQIEAEQFSNMPSPNITPEHWLQLARRINTVFEKRMDLAGVVVTDGT